MNADDEMILKIAKEVVIKFIELGRVSPTNFEATFRAVFWAVKNTVVDSRASALSGELLASSDEA